MKQKSKGVAYVLWFFLGVFGVHKFYLGKVGMGILYLFTLGILGIGWFIDLFTLGHQVDVYNALHSPRGVNVTQQQQQNIVVNVASPTGADTKISSEKQVLNLSAEKSILTTKDIVKKTSLDIDEAEKTLKRMVEKGIAKEVVSAEGIVSYDFS